MNIYGLDELKDDFYSKIEFENISSVSEIINAVRQNGDIAIREYAQKFGDGDISSFRLTDEEIQEAIKLVDEKTIEP